MSSISEFLHIANHTWHVSNELNHVINKEMADKLFRAWPKEMVASRKVAHCLSHNNMQNTSAIVCHKCYLHLNRWCWGFWFRRTFGSAGWRAQHEALPPLSERSSGSLPTIQDLFERRRDLRPLPQSVCVPAIQADTFTISGTETASALQSPHLLLCPRSLPP